MLRRALAISLIASLALVGLSGCLFLPPISIPLTDRNDDDPDDSDDDPAADDELPGPEGWRAFDHCSGGPDDDYVWVEGIPTTAIDEAGIEPSCGAVWFQDDGDHFVNVTDYEVTIEELDALRDLLLAEGWQMPVEEFKGPDLYARDFYLGDDLDTRLAIELYRNPLGGGSYTAYMDYLSPLTRALD